MTPRRHLLPAVVAEKLGHYVYLYVDPRDGAIFYVGKGAGQRALAHLDDTPETAKADRVRAIRASGAEPRIEILAHGLRDETEALRVEAAAIDLLGTRALTNLVRGDGSGDAGRASLAELVMRYGAEPVAIDVPAILFRARKFLTPDASAEDLYDATRGIWKARGRQRDAALYAMAVLSGVVREVYRIESWHPAGTTPYHRRALNQAKLEGRWEFTGSVAAPEVRDRFVGRSVEAYFPAGAQTPFTYVNCGSAPRASRPR